LLPINWIGFNYANDKKYDQKLQDNAKLEIDIINKDIIIVLIDDTIEMRDKCMSLHSRFLFFGWKNGYYGWLLIIHNS